MKVLYKEAKKAQLNYASHKGNDKVELNSKRRYFKEKQSVFDKELRHSKRAYMRNLELDIETMVGLNGKEMWHKLAKIGPFIALKKIKFAFSKKFSKV